jgi:hypothetical protein
LNIYEQPIKDGTDVSNENRTGFHFLEIVHLISICSMLSTDSIGAVNENKTVWS